VIIPISFVTENLETLYDIDRQIIPLGRKEFGLNISRVKISADHPLFIEMLKELVYANNN
jgi:protoheme ferro-lyase